MSHLTIQFMAIATRIEAIEKRIIALENKEVPHGRTRYAYGCRCDICKESAKLEMRKYRKKKLTPKGEDE